jgi:hypothetical protein
LFSLDDISPEKYGCTWIGQIRSTRPNPHNPTQKSGSDQVIVWIWI